MPRAKKWQKKRSDKGKKRMKTQINSNDPGSSRFSSPSPSRRSSLSSVSSESSTSSSESKIRHNLKEYDCFDSKSEYDIMDFGILSKELSSFAVCKLCSGHLSLSVKRRQGLAAKFELSCLDCGEKKDIVNSKMSVREVSGKNRYIYDINIRAVYAFRAIGKYKTAAATALGLMNLPPPPRSWGIHEQILATANEATTKESMKAAIVEAVQENEESRDISVAIDGTWQKRGHVSLNGVVTATSVDTGKVLDATVYSKFCRCPQKITHLPDCMANYTGVSGGMEVAGVREIFSRSLELYNVRYTNYLGDGDCKAFKKVVEDNPYGEDCPVQKLECVGHVQKRMGARLRRLKNKFKNKKLEDNKPLGGKNRLTDTAIDKLQTYYGLAIRRNTNNLENMRKAVWATYFHLGSNDENAEQMHTLCEVEWCKYKQYTESGKKYIHSEHFHLDRAILTVIKPIFQDLAHPDLLRKCLHGKTQNVNESLNNTIWRVIPKNNFVSLPTLKMGIHEAIGVFNEGCIYRCRILKHLDVEIGAFCSEAMLRLDKSRLKHAKLFETKIAEKINKRRSRTRRNLEELFEDEENLEGPSYGAGLH